MDTLARNLAIRQEHEGGTSYNSLARKYGLSAARIQQICDADKSKKVYTEPYKIRKIQQTIASVQVRLGRMTVELHAVASEVADLERLLQATLFAEGTGKEATDHI